MGPPGRFRAAGLARRGSAGGHVRASRARDARRRSRVVVVDGGGIASGITSNGCQLEQAELLGRGAQALAEL